MPVDSGCAGVGERLEAALLARTQPRADDSAHAAGCPRCGALARALGELERGLAAEPLEPSEAIVNEAWTAMRAALARAPDPHTPAVVAPGGLPQGLPDGFGRELRRLLAGALLPLPLVLALNAGLLALGYLALAPWLPAGVLSALGALYGLAAASSIALFFGSIPLLAHRRVVRGSLAAPRQEPST